ncbi:DUF3515 family protein [Microbacterium sp. 10M-3C3]|uniref:DUF3515 family protein n=1 Tax=Microbacterium sp. 10M-3C3 TaxID=2483401 RepID=UPI001F0BADAC|nr:DUF3515 family protein [Microbacterium sp. 10M-3C3]
MPSSFTLIAAAPHPPEALFELSLDIDAHVASLSPTGERAVGDPDRRVSATRLSTRIRRALVAALVVATAVTTSACSNTVSLEAARDANHPSCAALTVSLPQRVAGQDRRWTDAQATGAWGSPAAIIMTCGVEPTAPSELPCYDLGGVDWLALPQDESVQRAVTFGREPAVEVAVSRGSGIDFPRLEWRPETRERDQLVREQLRDLRAKYCDHWPFESA